MEFESWSDLRIPYALDEAGNMVEPHKAAKGVKYYCPECGQELTLRVGVVRRTHFAHQKGQAKCVFDGPDWEQYTRKHLRLLHGIEEHAGKPCIEEQPARDTAAAPERVAPPAPYIRPTPAIEAWQEEVAALAEPVATLYGQWTQVRLLGVVVPGCPIPARRGYYGSSKGKPAAHVQNDCTICPYYGGHTEVAALCKHPGWAEKGVIS